MKLLSISEENVIGSIPAKPTQVMMYHDSYTAGETTGGLSVIFTMLCIIDLFGVFPVVALPKSIISCGIYGIPLVLAVIALQLYTAVLLGRSWILAHDISPNIREKSRHLALASVFIVTTVAISTWTCIINDDKSPPPSGDVVAYIPTSRDFLVAYGIIVYQFDIHPMLLTLQVDMKDSRRIHSAVLGAFTVTGTMFTVTSFLAAKRYGNNVHSNILQGLPPSITLYIVALLVTLQLCLSSAVSNSALFQHIEDVFKIPREFCIQRCVIRSSIIALAVFLGESVPRFDLVMGLIGSTLTGPLMFIFPPIFFLRLCYKKSSLPNSATYSQLKTENLHKVTLGKLKNGNDPSRLALFMHSFDTKYKTFTNTLGKMGENDMDEYNIKWYDIVLAVLVMLLGILATALATYSSWSDAISSASFSPPCIVNSTAAARSFIERNIQMT
ncbi:proton-coupled amino acid transporter 2-like isoform X2 [Pieris brassicae]|uniref:proton-coupled amino acid transporter 2-like isoform X2 n=1 Tax=Pieris brassicae TaxID=7116 RepID=UPI001E65E848|nr:proton-coupled amino acid transporter 2-like isoform X2 [Pieris brassicae]